MALQGLLASRPTSRREHAIFVTRDGVECFEVFRGQRNADHDQADSKMRLKFIRDRATAPVLTSNPRDSRLLGFIDPTRDGTRSFPCPTFPPVWRPCPDEPLTIFVWNGSLEGLSETRSITARLTKGNGFLPTELSLVREKPRWMQYTYA